jgi:hypothetical protein
LEYFRYYDSSLLVWKQIEPRTCAAKCVFESSINNVVILGEGGMIEFFGSANLNSLKNFVKDRNDVPALQ